MGCAQLRSGTKKAFSGASPTIYGKKYGDVVFLPLTKKGGISTVFLCKWAHSKNQRSLAVLLTQISWFTQCVIYLYLSKHTLHISLCVKFFLLIQNIKDSGWHDIFKGIINFFWVSFWLLYCFDSTSKEKIASLSLIQEVEGRNWKPLDLLLGFSALWRS